MEARTNALQQKERQIVQGSPNLFPSFGYRDAGSAIDWLNRAFGFETVLLVPEEEGRIAHAELRLGAGIIMLGSEGQGEYAAKSPLTVGALTQGIYVCAQDPDALHRQALAAGARVVRELEDTDYGSRTFGALDLQENRWDFGTYDPMASESGANLFPCLAYRDAPGAIDWLIAAFGFDRKEVHTDEVGNMVHGEIAFRRNSVVMLGSEMPGDPYPVVSPLSSRGSITGGSYLFVDDVDAHHERAVAKGARIVRKLEDTDHGSRQYAALDPDGHRWDFGTYDPYATR